MNCGAQLRLELSKFRQRLLININTVMKAMSYSGHDGVRTVSGVKCSPYGTRVMLSADVTTKARKELAQPQAWEAMSLSACVRI